MGPRGVERGLEISKVGYPQITPKKQERYLERALRRVQLSCQPFGYCLSYMLIDTTDWQWLGLMFYVDAVISFP